MEGEIMSQEWELKVRVYPPLPQVEQCVIKFMRYSLPKNVDSRIEKWNFTTMEWDMVKPFEADTAPGPYCIAMPPSHLVGFATELLKGALRIEHV